LRVAIARRRSGLADDAEFVAQLVTERGARITLTVADAIAASLRRPTRVEAAIRLMFIFRFVIQRRGRARHC